MAATTSTKNFNMKWFGFEYMSRVRAIMHQRMKVAIFDLKQQTARNINKPVRYGPGGSVVERSKPGEYPRKETGDLQASLITDTTVSKSEITSTLGAGEDYAVILEKSLNREFLSRTLVEEWPRISAFLTGPIE